MKLLLIPTIVIPILLCGCNPSHSLTGNVEAGPQKYTTDVVKRQDLTGYSFFDGKLVIPDSAQASIASPFEAPVLSVSTRVGKQVQRGETIIKLTLPGSEAATTSANASASSAKADYSTQKGDASAPVIEAKRQLADARAAEKAARDTVASGGQADVESATQTRISAEAALRQAQQELRASLQSPKMAVDQAAASQKEAQAFALKGIIRSPLTGTVVSLEAQPGMKATANQHLATIINFEMVRVQGNVPPELKDLVVKNSHVIIAMNGVSSDPLDGLVLDVGVAPPREGQTSSGYLAVIRILSPQAIIQPSMSVKRIGVRAGAVANVLVIPADAVVRENGDAIVYVQVGDKWVKTTVATGITDGALIEIKSGLSEGAVVRVPVPTEGAPRS